MPSVADLVVAIGDIENGTLKIRNRPLFREQLRELRDGWTVEVTVKRLQATRSIEANRFYWAAIVQTLSDYTGYTADDIHDLLKAKFLPRRLAICDGNGVVHGEYVLGGSTRNLSIQDFSEYCEAIRQWAAETLDLDIPDPDSDVLPAPIKSDTQSRSVWYRAKRRKSS